MDALRWWVVEMHVDGFRFDLASILGRDPQGKVLANPPVVEMIAEDPILADTKIIAEAWDAAGLYQVGSFSPHPRWAEWNGRFRDDVRAFCCGRPGMVPALATRIAGSSDLYQAHGRSPSNSINFITSHDGFRITSYNVCYTKLLRLLAVASAAIAHMVVNFFTFLPYAILQPLISMLIASVWINIMLAVFNCIPIPPLDGSKVLMGLLSPQSARSFAKLEPYGFFILLALFYTGIISQLIMPIIRFSNSLLLG